MSWDRRFPEPIAVIGRRPLATLRDAATNVTGLSTDEQDTQRWQNAVHVLIQTADHGWPIEFARLGMMQALNMARSVASSSVGCGILTL